jgi:hypothetical protein
MKRLVVILLALATLCAIGRIFMRDHQDKTRGIGIEKMQRGTPNFYDMNARKVAC